MFLTSFEVTRKSVTFNTGAELAVLIGTALRIAAVAIAAATLAVLMDGMPTAACALSMDRAAPPSTSSGSSHDCVRCADRRLQVRLLSAPQQGDQQVLPRPPAGQDKAMRHVARASAMRAPPGSGLRPVCTFACHSPLR
ncbi:hypothetical protein T492DRAFT_850512 [Pavlovales sp. CCMP2436]|nr:hypothetical protein T492DRAFT_850512 [Pavlovales sp. CCMP2436]